MEPRSASRDIATSAGAALAVAALLLATPAAVRGQSVEDQIRLLASENAQLYTGPVVTGIGAGMNSGWFHTASPKGLFHVDVGIKVMGALVPESDDSFQPVLPDQISADVDGDGTDETFQDPYGTGAGLSTPTAVGPGAGITVQPQGTYEQALIAAGENPADFALPFPKGFDIPAVPMAVLQANVGLVLGTDVSVRYIPAIEVNSDVGTVEAFGLGGKHSISQWFPGSFPVDVAVAGGYQTFDVGDYLSAETRQASVIVSKDLAVLTVFGAAGLEKSEIDVTYDVQNAGDLPALPSNNTTVSFTQDSGTSERFTAGFNLDLLFLQLNASYSASDYDVVTASAGLTF